MLEAAGYRISKTDVAGRQEGDQPVLAHRIYLALPSGREVKVVRSEAGRHPARKCEISRDEIRGLTIGGAGATPSRGPAQEVPAPEA